MTEYYPGTSIIHRLDPRTKFVIFMCLIVLVVFISDPVIMLGIALFILLMYILAGIPLRRVKGMIVGVIPVIILFIVLNIFVIPVANPTLIGYIGGYPIALESVRTGLVGGLRFAVFVFFSRLLTMTTSIGELVSSLIKLRMPVEVAVAIGIGFSSVGILIDQIRAIKEAQMSRGAPIESRNSVVKAKALISVVVPAIYLTILRGLTIAKTLESRAFTYNPSKRTFRKIVKFSKLDYIVTISSIIVTLNLVIVFLLNR
jgi:energy-coupling factor transport system permease protein